MRLGIVWSVFFTRPEHEALRIINTSVVTARPAQRARSPAWPFESSSGEKSDRTISRSVYRSTALNKAEKLTEALVPCQTFTTSALPLAGGIGGSAPFQSV